MTLCNTNSFLKLHISAESPDPLPILSYRATVFEEYTSNKALSELQDCHFPFWHINAMPGSPGGSSMLWFSGWSRPRSNQNHFRSLWMPGVRLGNHVLRLEPFRCDVVSDPTGWWSTSWLASYSLWGWLMMLYTALAAKVDAVLATAICWLLASTCMLIRACKKLLSSCSSSRVFFGPLQVFSWLCRVIFTFQRFGTVFTQILCPHHKEFAVVNVVLAQPYLLQGNCICRICALPCCWVCCQNDILMGLLTRWK